MSRQKSSFKVNQPVSVAGDTSFSTSFTKAYSASTSRRSFAPTVFSHPETVTNTQTTVEISSQERKEVLEQFQSSDDFPASSGELLALRESFARHGEPGIDAAYPPSHLRLSDHALNQQLDDVPYPSVEGAEPVSPIPAEISRPSDLQPHLPVEDLEPPSSLPGRLEHIWPQFPKGLRDAPIAVVWEVTRICLHCDIDLAHTKIQYDPRWASQDFADLWKGLRRLDVFQGKSFPERPTAEAWQAALGSFTSRGNAVFLSLALDYNYEADGPLFHVRMQPVRLAQSYRLARRFGSDRFLDVLMPSPCSARNIPKAMKKDGAANEVIKWLTEKPHHFVGRRWMPFFVRDAGYRRQPVEFRLGGENDTLVYKDRVTFFAESGPGFQPLPRGSNYPLSTEVHRRRSEFKVEAMLKWLLQPEANSEQAHLKLFTRIQLGLSNTYPVFVFEPDQIRHQADDLKSPAGNVMNDGIGLMSRAVARRVRDELGLPDIPSAVQGRLGSAKGMWLLDVNDTGDDYWIEIYPSQRKWRCDFVDEHHRTFEIRSHAHELRTAALNLQFLPVLEDRASDKAGIRQILGDMLTKDLEDEFDEHKSAMQRPIEFRSWSHNGFSMRASRLYHGHVPFLGGLPVSKEETLSFLLDSGFDPTQQKYLQEIAWQVQKQKCDLLKTKLKIKVGRSAYAYMVVDFWGILEEGEVHFAFSSKFGDDDSSDILLHDMDVLVARSPAHYPSDIQRVRAVFKTELRALKDVIVFSSKGNTALADSLSGGDYDGDQAWVCWDPRIVEGFVNAPVPLPVDLKKYMRKDETTYGQLMQGFGRQATRKMIERSFQFSMQHNMLGVCTNYKERFCYTRNCVSDNKAILLSTLLSNLVDQLKNGISFGHEDFDQLIREELGAPLRLGDPAYKDDAWRRRDAPKHIVDYLKFSIAKPAIDRELAAYHKAMEQVDSPLDGAHRWDADLSTVYEDFRGIKSQSCQVLLTALIASIGEVEMLWKRKMAREKEDYAGRIKEIHAEWCKIQPKTLAKNGAKIDSKMVRLLEQQYLPDTEMSHWALLKASTAFKLYYNKSNKFVWQIAGRQLAMIKAMMTKGDGVPVLAMPLMYAALMPDKRFVKQYVAKLEGSGSDYMDELERSQAETDGADLYP
ncbi:hypothetical protein GQ53DRAFT_742330 [Thozetella sp. PMI_491]|nr:hypothetical protein GQ53DRAFT_742330 [Thozetella sp. PMI_491]